MFLQQEQLEIAPRKTAELSEVNLIYRGETVLQIRGAVTGRNYQFSPLAPIQSIDRRDAAFIRQTRLLRPLTCR
jgi:hypothetical protein